MEKTIEALAIALHHLREAPGRGSVALGAVMTLAMTLNLVLAALMGVAVPYVQARFGKNRGWGRV